jgi:hypothetical protein
LKERGPEAWQIALDEITRSSFLRGSSSSGWQITIDWLLKPSNFTKVLEGNYRDRSSVPARRNDRTESTMAALRHRKEADVQDCKD